LNDVHDLLGLTFNTQCFDGVDEFIS